MSNLFYALVLITLAHIVTSPIFTSPIFTSTSGEMGAEVHPAVILSPREPVESPVFRCCSDVALSKRKNVADLVNNFIDQ